jgi:hypothetical protein
MIRADFQGIQSGFSSCLQIKDRFYAPASDQFNLQTAQGRLLKLRDEIAKQCDEGPEFIMEESLI